MKLSELEAALEGLGPTPEHIAHTIFVSGVKGKRYEPFECALARYLQRIIRQAHIGVGTYGVTTVAGKALLPDAVRQFVYNYDAFRWPELVEG